jgi:glycosyltransferase involved in cell wall biosynthesis
MSTPIVSILIRSIARKSLEETLNSVGKLTYPNIEILVIAAVPNHPALSVQHDTCHAQLVLTDRPLHRSTAANKALQLAKGEYALLLDDDDWISPDHISNLVDALQNAPSYLVAYSRTQTVNAAGEAKDHPVMGLPYDPLRLLAGNWMPPHSVLFSIRLRELGCRFDEQLDLYEDWDFWLQAAQHSHFLYVPVITAFYRIHDSSGVHKQAPFHGNAAHIIYEKWRSLWSPEQVGLVMERNWQHSDWVVAVENKTAELAHQATVIEQQRDRVYALENHIEQLESQSKQLEDRCTVLEGQQHALQQELTQLLSSTVPKLQHEQELATLYNSRSWRWMSPVRWFFNGVRRWRAQSRSWFRVIKTMAVSLPKLPKLLRKYSIQDLSNKVQAELHLGNDYLDWIKANEPTPDQVARMRGLIPAWSNKPLVSVLMPTYNSPLNYLQEAIESVQAQVYEHWELCIADDASPRPEVRKYLMDAAQKDPRIVLSLREKNGHISESSNTALHSASGEWVALLDHDDRLHPLALFWVVNALQKQPDANIIFSDEDKIDGSGVRFGPYFKGEYNRELMWAQNMISHLGCYRRSELLEIGGFRVGYEGSQDYDLALRVIERSAPHQIVHVPRVLYHWRAIAGSTALAADQKPYAESASRKALEGHLERIGLAATVSPSPEIPSMNRVMPALPTPLPMVSILIPTRDRIELLKTCIESLLKLSTYPHIEILVIDNGSVEPNSLLYFEQLKAQGIGIIRDDGPFNYSALNNRAAKQAKGEFLCLMNNDIEIITPNWLEEMLSFAALPDVGAVGTRLWYPNNQGLQHGGVIIGMGGVAGHAHSKSPKGHAGYFGRIALHHRLLAVTAACLLIRKSHYEKVGGLDEKLAVAFNDVDFCLRLHQAGFACIYTPFAEMVHHESASRGDDLTGERHQRFVSEVHFMMDRWQDRLNDDPFFSPNLSLAHGDFRPAIKSRVASVE